MRERAEHRQAMWQHKRMTERERKNAGRPLSSLSAPCAAVSAHQPWPENVCVCVFVDSDLS